MGGVCGGVWMKGKKCTWPPMAMLKIWGSSAMIGTMGMDSTPHPPLKSFTFVKVKVTSPALVQVIALLSFTDF